MIKFNIKSVVPVVSILASAALLSSGFAQAETSKYRFESAKKNEKVTRIESQYKANFKGRNGKSSKHRLVKQKKAIAPNAITSIEGRSTIHSVGKNGKTSKFRFDQKG